jgi:hypothetical protein
LREQLGWTSGEHLLASPVSDPDTFADNCARLAADETLWRRVRAAALDRVAVECAPAAAAETLRRLLDGVMDRAA